MGMNFFRGLPLASSGDKLRLERTLSLILLALSYKNGTSRKATQKYSQMILRMKASRAQYFETFRDWGTFCVPLTLLAPPHPIHTKS